jgi:tRNA (guanine10-N2)-dimethyltransferase
MKKIFILSKLNIGFAKEEVLSLVGTKSYEIFDNLLIVNDLSKLMLENRLGFSHSIFRFLFKCKKEKLREKIKSYNWQKIYRKNFCIRVHNSKDFPESNLSKIIYKSLKNPVVNLKNPQTKIEFFFKNSVVIVGLFLNKVNKSFLKRKAHLRPEFHPTSLHPGLARGCINLTRLKTGVILDPFCGSGGILIEAGLMNFKVRGYDIDDTQLERARKNLEYYKIKDYKLEKRDAIKINTKVDAIVTDLPYGKSSKATNIDKLYEEFLKYAIEFTDNIVIIFPSFINYNNIILRTNWKIKNEFKIYIHKSLCRIIINLVPLH